MGCIIDELHSEDSKDRDDDGRLNQARTQKIGQFPMKFLGNYEEKSQATQDTARGSYRDGCPAEIETGERTRDHADKKYDT